MKTTYVYRDGAWVPKVSPAPAAHFVISDQFLIEKEPFNVWDTLQDYPPHYRIFDLEDGPIDRPDNTLRTPPFTAQRIWNEIRNNPEIWEWLRTRTPTRRVVRFSGSLSLATRDRPPTYSPGRTQNFEIARQANRRHGRIVDWCDVVESDGVAVEWLDRFPA